MVHWANDDAVPLCGNAPQLADWLVWEELCGGVSAERDYHLWGDQRDLAIQIRGARLDLDGEGVAVVGGAALDHVGDEHVLPFYTDACEQLVEELSCASNEREALLVFVVSRAFANEHHVGREGTVAWDGLGSLRSQGAEGAFVDAPLEIVGRCGEDVFARHGVHGHGTNGVGGSSIGGADDEGRVGFGRLTASMIWVDGHSTRSFASSQTHDVRACTRHDGGFNLLPDERPSRCFARAWRWSLGRRRPARALSRRLFPRPNGTLRLPRGGSRVCVPGRRCG